MPGAKSSTGTKVQTADARKSSADVDDDLLDEDEGDAEEAAIDWSADNGDNRSTRQLQARRRIEDLMEERQMRQLLGDDWNWDL